MYRETEYERASNILESIWVGINWEKVDKGRRRTIQGEFEGQSAIRARQTNSLTRFISVLANRFDSQIKDKEVLELLKMSKGDEKITLDIIRYETQIPVLMMKIRREKAQDDYQKWIDISPEHKGKTFKQVKEESPQLFED